MTVCCEGLETDPSGLIACASLNNFADDEVEAPRMKFTLLQSDMTTPVYCLNPFVSSN